MKRIVFKDELCDAVWTDIDFNTIEIICPKGKLRISGTTEVQFEAYHSWCKDCGKKHLVNRKDLEDAFNSLAINVKKQLCE